MQGSYKNNGLPRPYYMKPNRRGSAYEKLPRQVFYTNTRKLSGYIVMLVLFGLCVYMIGKEFRAPVDNTYELLNTDGSSTSKNSGDVDRLVDSAKVDDKAAERLDLAENKAQNSKGEYGHAVLEAPKGGMVNEGPIVGNDEGLVIDGKKKIVKGDEATGGNTVQAVRAATDGKKTSEKAADNVAVDEVADEVEERSPVEKAPVEKAAADKAPVEKSPIEKAPVDAADKKKDGLSTGDDARVPKPVADDKADGKKEDKSPEALEVQKILDESK